jgi:hypothetical protein
MIVEVRNSVLPAEADVGQSVLDPFTNNPIGANNVAKLIVYVKVAFPRAKLRYVAIYNNKVEQIKPTYWWKSD